MITRRKMDRHRLAIAVVTWAACLASIAAAYDLTVLHTNDVHARFEEHGVKGGRCKPEDGAAGKCYGGVARRATKVREIRGAQPNTILVDGGDQFQGTLWFFHYRGDAAAHFMNKIGYDVMALGNHEFDNKVNGLLPFLQKVNFDVVSSNIDTSPVPAMTSLLSKSVVKVINGEKIGVVGYTSKDTPILSDPAPLTFAAEVESVQAEVDKLTAQGVNKIIAVGHSGIDTDKDVANRVRGVDVVVGGHTNTFLYTGNPPSIEVPDGPYPTVITQDSGDKVLVVQDYTFGKYLGNLLVSFDDDGKVTSWSGNPILLDSSVAQDNDTLKDVDVWSVGVSNATSQVIGKSHVYLDGNRKVCRVRECNMGNLITDAFIHQNLKHLDGMEWSDVAIALVNSGGIRAPIERGDITIGDVKTVAPFENVVNIIEITGKTLLGAMEHAVTDYDTKSPAGRFLQVSGIKVVYDLSKVEGERVISVSVRCTKCLVPEFVPLDLKAVYKVVTNEFISNGGDGFSVLKDNIIKTHYQGDVDSDLIAEYIKNASPVYPEIEGRIIFNEVPSSTSSRLTISHTVITFLSIIASLRTLVNEV